MRTHCEGRHYGSTCVCPRPPSAPGVVLRRHRVTHLAQQFRRRGRCIRGRSLSRLRSHQGHVLGTEVRILSLRRIPRGVLLSLDGAR